MSILLNPFGRRAAASKPATPAAKAPAKAEAENAEFTAPAADCSPEELEAAYPGQCAAIRGEDPADEPEMDETTEDPEATAAEGDAPEDEEEDGPVAASPAAHAALAAAFAAEFKDEPAFALAAMGAGLSLEQARTQLAAVRGSSRSKAVRDQAARTVEPVLHKDGSPSGVGAASAGSGRPERFKDDRSGFGDRVAAFMAEGKSEADAIRAAVKQHPQLHQAYLQASRGR